MKHISLVFKFSFILFVLEETSCQQCDLSQVFRTPKDMSKVNMDHFELIERGNFDQSGESTTVPPTNERTTSDTSEGTPRAHANAQVLLRFGGDNIQGQNRIFVPPQCRRFFDTEGNYAVPHHHNYYPNAPLHAPSSTYYPYPPPTPYVFPNYYYHCPPYLPPQLQKYYMLTPNGYLRQKKFQRQDAGNYIAVNQGINAGTKLSEETDAIYDMIRDSHITPIKNKHHPMILQPTDLTNEEVAGINLVDDINVNFSQNSERYNPGVEEYEARKVNEKSKQASRQKLKKKCIKKSVKHFHQSEKHGDRPFELQRENEYADEGNTDEATPYSHIQKIENSVEKSFLNSQEHSKEILEVSSATNYQGNFQEFSEESSEEFVENPETIFENYPENGINVVEKPIVIPPESKETVKDYSTTVLSEYDSSSSSEEESEEIVEAKASAKATVRQQSSFDTIVKTAKICTKKPANAVRKPDVATTIDVESSKKSSKSCLKKVSKAVRKPDVRFVIIDASKLRNKSSQHLDQLLNDALVPYLCKKCSNDKPKMLVSYPITSEKDSAPRILQGDSCPMCYRNPDTPFGKRFLNDVDVLGALDTSKIVSNCKCNQCNCVNCGCMNTNANGDRRPSGGKGFEKDIDDLYEMVIVSLTPEEPIAFETYQDFSDGSYSFPQPCVSLAPLSPSRPQPVDSKYDIYDDTAAPSYPVDITYMGSLQQYIPKPKNIPLQSGYGPITRYSSDLTTSAYYQNIDPKPDVIKTKHYQSLKADVTVPSSLNTYRQEPRVSYVEKYTRPVFIENVVNTEAVIPKTIDYAEDYPEDYQSPTPYNPQHSSYVNSYSHIPTKTITYGETISKNKYKQSSNRRPNSRVVKNRSKKMEFLKVVPKFDIIPRPDLQPQPVDIIPIELPESYQPNFVQVNDSQSFLVGENMNSVPLTQISQKYITPDDELRPRSNTVSKVSNYGEGSCNKNTDFDIYISARPAAAVSSTGSIISNNRPITEINTDLDVNYINTPPQPSYNQPAYVRDTKPTLNNNRVTYVNTNPVVDNNRLTYVSNKPVAETESVTYVSSKTALDVNTAPSVHNRPVIDDRIETYVNTKPVVGAHTDFEVNYINTRPRPSYNEHIYVRDTRPALNTNSIRVVNTKPIPDRDTVPYVNTRPVIDTDSATYINTRPVVSTSTVTANEPVIGQPLLVSNANSRQYGIKNKFCQSCGQALSFYPSTGRHYCSSCPKETVQLNSF